MRSRKKKPIPPIPGQRLLTEYSTTTPKPKNTFNDFNHREFVPTRQVKANLVTLSSENALPPPRVANKEPFLMNGHVWTPYSPSTFYGPHEEDSLSEGEDHDHETAEFVRWLRRNCARDAEIDRLREVENARKVEEQLAESSIPVVDKKVELPEYLEELVKALEEEDYFGDVWFDEPEPEPNSVFRYSPGLVSCSIWRQRFPF
jgi:hypothetical protein